MKRLIIICCCMLLAWAMQAEKRTPADAMQIAVDFASQQRQVQPVLKRSSTTSITPVIVQQNQAYFAVNTANGFVLVGADDRLPEVIGYSDSASPFCPDSLPENLRYWLRCYEEQATAIINLGLQRQPLATTAATDVTYVGPLLTATWNQGAPYNNLTPVYSGTQHAATGCVATAAAQIMYYWRYPAQGTGSHSYAWTNSFNKQTTTLYVNFAATTYDWDNMRDNITISSPEETQNAVATLMYHAGVSCDMTYASDSTSSSGAVPSKMAAALRTYFGYDSNLQTVIYRKNYTSDNFEQLLRDEIDAGRPILYSGWTASGGGHSFVCDGYSSNGLFHINWGWGGKSNGYFISSLMNPYDQGIGGSTGEYSESQQVAVGIQPTMQYHKLRIDSLVCSVAQTSRTGTFSVSLPNLTNLEWSKFSGSVGLALYNEEGTTLLCVLSSASQTLNAKAVTNKTLSGISVPSSYEAGYYQVVAVYKDTDGTWRPLQAKGDNFRMLQLTSSNMEFYSDKAEPVLTLLSPIGFADNAAVSHQGAVLTYKIQNTGGTFRGDVQAFIYKGKLARGEFGSMQSNTVKRNATEEYNVIDNLSNDAGNYTIQLRYRLSSDDAWKDFLPADYSKVSFTLLDDQLPSLYLTQQIGFIDNTSVPYRNARLCFNLSNTGGTFNGNLQAFLYEGTSNKGEIDAAKLISLAKSQTLADTLLLQFDTIYSDNKTYTLILRQKVSTDNLWDDIFPSSYAACSFRFREKINYSEHLYDTICEGETVTFQGETYNATDDYVWKTTTSNGCDSIQTLHLQVLPNQTVTIEKTIHVDSLPYTDGIITIPADYAEDTYQTTLPSENEPCTSLYYNITIDRTSPPTDAGLPAVEKLTWYIADGLLWLMTDGTVQHVRLYSAQGMLLQSIDVAGKNIPIKQPSAGIYLLQCVAPAASETLTLQIP